MYYIYYYLYCQIKRRKGECSMKRQTLRHFLGILLAVAMVLSTVPTDGLSFSVNAQEIDVNDKCEGGGKTLNDVSYMKLAVDADVSDESGTNVATVTVNGSESKTYSYAENSDCTTPAAALQAAWNDATQKSTETSPATLTLLENVDLGNSNLTLASANSNVILTMDNDVTLTSSSTYFGVIIINSGKLTMQSGKIINNSNDSTKNRRGVYVGNSAEFTMTGGVITSDCGVAIYDNGSANIDGNAEIHGVSYAITVNGTGTVTIGGSATIEGQSTGVGAYNQSKVTIKDSAKITSEDYGLYLNSDNPSAEITGGTIIGEQYGVEVSAGSLVMKSGDVLATNQYGVCVSGSGNADISGGKVKGERFGLYVWYNSIGNIIISGGTFIGNTYYSISVNKNNATVKDLLKEDCDYFQGEGISEETRICNKSILSQNNLDKSDGYGTVTVAQVPLSIQTRTEDQILTYGDKRECTLAVEAVKTGSASGDISYQWYQNGTKIVGAAEDSYSITNFDAGNYQYYCVVTCDGYEINSKTVNVTISPKIVTASIVDNFTKNKVYDGTTNVTGSVNISLEGVVNDDKVTAKVASCTYDSSDAGNRTITASGITLDGQNAKNYTLANNSATTNGKIEPLDISSANVIFDDISDLVYDGTEKKPDVTVNKNGMTLKKGSYYIENYTNNINAGTATVTIIAAENGNYVGTIKKEFSIIQATPEIYTTPSVADRVYNPFMSLKDSDLTGGKVSVNGTWSWQSKDIVPTVDNNGYVAVFTPNDSNNYKTVTITIPVAVTKAVPYIASPPAAAAITYGDALHTSELTEGTVQYGNGAGQAGSETGSTKVIAGVFTWKDASIIPTVADSDVTEYTVVFTPADSANYSVAETKITITVNEARKPQNTPYGNIIVTEPIISDDAPHISIVGSEDEIKEAVPLTEEEKAAVAAGSEIKIYLKIEKKTVTQEEKQIIDAAKEDYMIGEYIDVSMFKQIDGKEESPVRQLNKKIEISLVVPENLRNKNNNLTRIYAIIHHHSGEDKAEILQGVYDERTFSFTFTTDRFSTYTIVYKDTEKQTGNISYPIINGGGYATDFTQTSSPYPSVKPSAMPTAKPSQTPQTSTAPNTSAVPNASVVPTQEPVQDNVTPAPSQTPSDKMVNKDRLALNAGFKVSQTGNKIKILWGEVSGADGYDVYAQYCGKKFNSKPSNSVKSGKVTKVSIKKINGKKLNLKKSYKLYVAAYKLVNGKKIIMCKSIIAHNAGIKNKKYTNVKDIKVKKTSYTLKEGETAKINAITVLVDKKKKMLSDNHAKEFRYATSNREVAVVSSSGKIKATKKGSCIIYVYGKNGNTKKIKVKVK